MTEGPMMVGAATLFAVTDITQSISYRDLLGFRVTFEYGQPVTGVCPCLNEVFLHLVASTKTKRQPGHGAVCVFVRDVDRVYAEFWGRGVG